jgi:4-hydroxy-tetrahydrodipicolinate synthase
VPNPRNFALYTAIVTPFNDDGSVNFTELETLLREQARAGNGVVVLGSTGEGMALSDDEKLAVVKHAAGLGLGVPLLVGAAGFQLAQTLSFLRAVDSLPVDGYLMPVPLYAKPGLEGQTAWFTALLDAVSKPSMLYNVPSRAGVKLHPEALRRLSQHRNAWAVKEASGSVSDFQAYRKAAPQLAFYSGDDALLPEFVQEGAVGLVSVASNAWPEETARYVRLSLEGKGPACADLWRPATESLFTAANPVPVKALLQRQGKISRAKVRAPLCEKDLLSAALLEHWNNEVREWHRSL